MNLENECLKQGNALQDESYSAHHKHKRQDLFLPFMFIRDDKVSNLREVGLTRRRRQTLVCRSALADSRRSGEASPIASIKLRCISKTAFAVIICIFLKAHSSISFFLR